MSTKAIREALRELADGSSRQNRLAQEALLEVEAIEKACRTVNDCGWTAKLGVSVEDMRHASDLVRAIAKESVS